MKTEQSPRPRSRAWWFQQMRAVVDGTQEWQPPEVAHTAPTTNWLADLERRQEEAEDRRAKLRGSSGT